MSGRRHSSAHVFVDDLTAPELNDDDRHHLSRVLRLRDGETISVSDGRGRWRTCRFNSGGLLAPDSEIIDEGLHDRESVVVFALTKGDKPELVVQKLTEIGVGRIVPMMSERSIAKWDDDKAVRNIERLRKVAREAAMQSRRVTIPEIGPMMESVAAVVSEFGSVVALAEPGAPLISDVSGVEVLVVGPEGGFSPAELAACERHVSLPGEVLRAETAAIVAGAMLVHGRGLEHGEARR